MPPEPGLPAKNVFFAVLILSDKTSCILYVFMIYSIKRRTVLGHVRGSRQPPASDSEDAARRLPASGRCIAPLAATRQRFRLRPPHRLRQAFLSLCFRQGAAPHFHREFLARARETPPAHLAARRTLALPPVDRKLSTLPPSPRRTRQTAPADRSPHRPPGSNSRTAAPPAGFAPAEKIMDLISFQYDRSFVLEALRQGDIDYLEHVSEAAEADLFRHLIRRQVIQRLADTYPTPRKKEEVPVWIYLSSELTLKLHGAQSYHAFPRILRSGGLIEALGPEMGGRKTRHPETGDVTLACPGFNDKNDYDRQSPCDQDFLRKFAHDTKADLLHAWFNREVPRCLRSLGLFDPEGLFIGDASYLFVPDNDHYEQSDLLWFDEHNHPVDSDKVDLRDKRYQQHRCYKLVSLIHVNRKLDFFFVVAARVVPGRRHECPILYELVEEVVRAVHKGFIKVLIVDRGLIDGERMGHLKQKLAIDTIVPLRTNMDLYADAIGLTRLRGFTWEPYVPPVASPLAPTASPRPAAVEKREAKRQRTLAKRKAEAAAATAPAFR